MFTIMIDFEVICPCCDELIVIRLEDSDLAPTTTEISSNNSRASKEIADKVWGEYVYRTEN